MENKETGGSYNLTAMLSSWFRKNEEKQIGQKMAQKGLVWKQEEFVIFYFYFCKLPRSFWLVAVDSWILDTMDFWSGPNG